MAVFTAFFIHFITNYLFLICEQSIISTTMSVIGDI